MRRVCVVDIVDKYVYVGVRPNKQMGNVANEAIMWFASTNSPT